MALEALRSSTSVALQGKPQTASREIFLFPDGSGAATAYINLPLINPSDLVIYALNCPYVRHPEEMASISLDALIIQYIKEIKRRKPIGPYHLGGWSAGGALTLRAAAELIDQDGGSGEQVIASMTLIDPPLPGNLDRLPQKFLDHIRDVGVFSPAGSPGTPKRELPKNLLPHFNGTTDVLESYLPEPLDLQSNHGPLEVAIVYATRTALGGDKRYDVQPGDTEAIRFLTDDRTDFSANGWRKLLPGAIVEVTKVEGANHFSLMVCSSLLSRISYAWIY